MPNLFLIDGIPGSGKSNLMSHCSKGWRCAFLKKYTNKDKEFDSLERPDLEYVSDERLNSIRADEDFWYTYPKKSSKKTEYLIRRSELDSLLKSNENVFIIVRSTETIQRIKKEYERFLDINVVSIFVYCDSQKLEERTRIQIEEANKGISEEKIKKFLEKRLSRNNECLEAYSEAQKNDNIYDHVIINNLDQYKFYSDIDTIVNKHVVLNKKSAALKVFVIMPMPDKHEAAHFFNVKEAIYEGASKAGFEALRLDDSMANRAPIHSQIKEKIRESTVCIVDLTNNRPNCYFEAGLAFEKKPYNVTTTFLIAEKGTEIEFDLNGNDRKEYTYSLNDYSNIVKIVKELLVKFKNEHIFISKDVPTQKYYKRKKKISK